MVTLIPLPAIPIRADAPILANVQTLSNAANLAQSLDDVQQLREANAVRPDGGRGRGTYARSRLRRLLEALLEAAEGMEDEAPTRPGRLWFPPTAFAISRIFLLGRLGFLEMMEKHIRIGFLALRPLDRAMEINGYMEALAAGEGGQGVSDRLEDATRQLLEDLAANGELATRYFRAVSEARDVVRAQIVELWDRADRTQEDEDTLVRLTGMGAWPGEPDFGAISLGAFGALDEGVALFERLMRVIAGFGEQLERVVNGNFNQKVLENGAWLQAPEGRPVGVELLDCRDIAFKGDQRRINLRMMELAVLRDVITVEIALRPVPEMPRFLRTYTRASGLLVEPPDGVAFQPVSRSM